MNEPQPRLWTKNFISIAATNFFLFLNFYFLLVTLPMYVVEDMGGTKSSAGLLTTAFLLTAILIRPFAGYAIGKLGSKPILILSLSLFLASTFLYYFANTISALLIIRLLHGLGFGMATTATGTIAASIIPHSRRGEGMGYFILSSTLAMVIGPYLGLTAMQEGGVTSMLMLAAAASIIGMAAATLVKITKRSAGGKKASEPRFNFSSLFEASAIPISVTGAFFAVIYSAILSFISVFANEMHLGNAASYFYVVYAVVLLLSRPFTGRWFDRYGANVIVFPAIVLFAIGMFMLGNASTASLFLIAAAFTGLGWGTLFPTFQTIAIQSAPAHRAPMATATFLSIFDFGVGLGSYIVGLIAAGMPFSQMYAYGSIYVLAGIGVYIFLHLRPHKRRNQEEPARRAMEAS